MSVFSPKQRGFTLLELLVVIALLAVVAGVALLNYEGVQDQGRNNASLQEMAQIRSALLQFRRDSGSNDFPGQGIYSCTDPADNTQPNPDMVFPTEAGSTDTEQIAWCRSPANFWMLFANPFEGSSTFNFDWNPDTRRGWNGPYLQRKSGFVDIGDDLLINAEGSGEGTGSPTSGNTIADVWGIADPYLRQPDNGLLSWSNVPGGDIYERFGRPYLMFDLDDQAPSQARVVGMAGDGAYDPQDTPNCAQSIGDDGFPLDHILCLLR